MQLEQNENLYDGCGNTSTSVEFGKIRRCFDWRHEMDQSNGSRRRDIAKAKIISAFIDTEVEVNVLQIWFIVVLLERKGATEHCFTNA